MKILVTAEDIEGSKRFDINNPFIYALQRTTGTLWLMSDCGVALEVTPPYRIFILPEETLEVWNTFKQTGHIAQCEFKVEFRHLQQSGM